MALINELKPPLQPEMLRVLLPHSLAHDQATIRVQTLSLKNRDGRGSAELFAPGRVDEDEVPGETWHNGLWQRSTMQGHSIVHTQSARVGLDDPSRRPASLEEIDARGASGEGLEADDPAPAEEISDPRLRQALSEHAEDRFSNASQDWTSLPARRRLENPTAKLTADDAHRYPSVFGCRAWNSTTSSAPP